MIPPVSSSAGSSPAPSRPPPEEIPRSNLAHPQAPHASAESDDLRVDISPEGVAQSRAEAAPSPPAQAGPPAPTVDGAGDAMLLARPGLSFSKADTNEDGVVTLPEEHTFEARHLQQTQAPPAEARPDSDYSEPIRTYRSVEATLASI